MRRTYFTTDESNESRTISSISSTGTNVSLSVCTSRNRNTFPAQNLSRFRLSIAEAENSVLCADSDLMNLSSFAEVSLNTKSSPKM